MHSERVQPYVKEVVLINYVSVRIIFSLERIFKTAIDQDSNVIDFRCPFLLEIISLIINYLENIAS